MSLVLGEVEFDGFEIPARIDFGGRQQLKVHRLIGGARVIDSLGRDDSALSWSGVLTGSLASPRARDLDALRASGSTQTLSWDAFSYAVIIAELKLEFRNPWWIPYQIICTVSRDLAQGSTPYLPNLASAIQSDLTAAAALLQGLGIPTPAPGYDLTRPDGRMQLKTALLAVQDMVNNGIDNTDLGVASGDLGSLVATSGTLAQLCSARGFLDRSTVNLEDLVTQ